MLHPAVKQGTPPSGTGPRGCTPGSSTTASDRRDGAPHRLRSRCPGAFPDDLIGLLRGHVLHARVIIDATVPCRREMLPPRGAPPTSVHRGRCEWMGATGSLLLVRGQRSLVRPVLPSGQWADPPHRAWHTGSPRLEVLRRLRRPVPTRSADDGPGPTAPLATRRTGRGSERFPCSLTIRSMKEEPNSVPAASPRLPRSTSPWPPEPTPTCPPRSSPPTF